MASTKNTNEYPIHVLREHLRQQATRQASCLSRSVTRLTSYDALPCTEYRQEVASQYAIVEKLIYLQQCRSALEQCIASGASRLRFRWRDGHMTDTRFRKTSPARIRISGLLAENPMQAAS